MTTATGTTSPCPSRGFDSARESTPAIAPPCAADGDTDAAPEACASLPSVHLVTVATWGGAPLFRDCKVARIAARIVHSPRTWQDAQCLAWVLMPDYWHGMVRLNAGGNIGRAVGRLKRRVSRGLRDEGRGAPVWQRVFASEALEEGVDLVAVARELVITPVRAKLVPRVGQYPYWNAVWLKD